MEHRNSPPSLQVLAARATGENRGSIGLESICDLPSKAISTVSWFLSISDLLLLHEDLTRKGVDVQPLWKDLVGRLWPWRYGLLRDVVINTFGEVCRQDFRSGFCLHVLLEYLSLRQSGLSDFYGLLHKFFIPLHKFETWHRGLPSCTTCPETRLEDVLLRVCSCLQYLPLNIYRLEEMLKDHNQALLKTLQTNVCNIRFQSVGIDHMVFVLPFLINTMAQGTLAGLELEYITVDEVSVLVLLLVCTGAVHRVPEAVQALKECLPHFATCQVTQAFHALKQIHDYIFPEHKYETVSDDSDEDGTDDEHQDEFDLFDDALLLSPITGTKKVKTDRMLHWPINKCCSRGELATISPSRPSGASSTYTAEGSKRGCKRRKLSPGPAAERLHRTADPDRDSQCFCCWWSDGSEHAPARTDGLPIRGLDSFVLKRNRAVLGHCLELTLPLWSSLRKLHLCKVDFSDSRAARVIADMVESGQLTHLVLDTVISVQPVMPLIWSALVSAQNGGARRCPVLQCLKLIHLDLDSPYTPNGAVHVPTSLFGVRQLELDFCLSSTVDWELLFACLRADESMEELTFNAELAHVHHWVFERLLSSLVNKVNLRKVVLGKISLSEAAQRDLMKLISNNQRLQSLTLHTTLLDPKSSSPAQSGSEFIQVVVSHSSLKQLNLRGVVADVALALLEAVFTRDASLQTLNLVACGLELGPIMAMMKRLSDSGIRGQRDSPKLKYLDLGENRLTTEDLQTLKEVLHPFVHEILFENGPFYFIDSLKEFMAMM